MTRHPFILTCAVGTLITSGHLVHGQQPAQPVYPNGNDTLHQQREMLLEKNTSSLDVTVSLDRADYLPGEAACATISIANMTASALEVFEPFKPGTGAPYVQAQLTPPDTPYKAEERRCCTFGRRDTLPTRWFAAGEVFQQSFNSYDDWLGGNIESFRIPQEPGHYKLSFIYGPPASANFVVLPATLGRDAYVPLQKSGQYSSGGKTFQVQRVVPLVVLDSGAMHHLVISLTNNRIARDNPTNLLSGWSRVIEPFIRIFSSNQPITAVGGTADPQENLTVAWTTADGKSYTANLGPDRKLKP
ncbi:MAG: hypothetical protein JO307_09445 [Bryobacterales bacterium]|nr:hypothetical protein [Bryobacterales bacterium]